MFCHVLPFLDNFCHWKKGSPLYTSAPPLIWTPFASYWSWAFNRSGVAGCPSPPFPALGAVPTGIWFWCPSPVTTVCSVNAAVASAMTSNFEDFDTKDRVTSSWAGHTSKVYIYIYILSKDISQHEFRNKMRRCWSQTKNQTSIHWHPTIWKNLTTDRECKTSAKWTCPVEKLWPQVLRWHDQNTDQAFSFISKTKI